MAEVDIASVLRDHGLRMTGGRKLIWDTIGNAPGHVTAQEVAEQVRAVDESVNLSSVYRSLTLFAELGLVRESKLGVDGASRWEPTHTDDHFHLVCRSCSKVDHHAGEVVGRIRAHLGDDHGFFAESIELVATGLCADCVEG